jgi:hypothetical protein
MEFPFYNPYIKDYNKLFTEEIFCIFTKNDTMTFEKTYDIQKNNQLIINLPDTFKSKKKVRVIIEDIDESRESKIALLKNASSDPLFLSDVSETLSDFEKSDNELR